MLQARRQCPKALGVCKLWHSRKTCPWRVDLPGRAYLLAHDGLG